MKMICSEEFEEALSAAVSNRSLVFYNAIINLLLWLSEWKRMSGESKWLLVWCPDLPGSWSSSSRKLSPL